MAERKIPQGISRFLEAADRRTCGLRREEACWKNLGDGNISGDKGFYEQSLINSQTVDRLLNGLTLNQKAVVIDRLMYGNTLEEAAQSLGLSKQRIVAIQASAMWRMKIRSRSF